MIVQPTNAERLVQLLVWTGGVATTIVGTWVASKIRVYHDQRNAHRDDLKRMVLEPIRAGLAEHFRPLVFNQAPILTTQHAARKFNPKAKVTQDPIEEGPVLLAAAPMAKVFGPVDEVLLEDARKNHHSEAIAQADKFVSSWAVHAGNFHGWAMRVANEILTVSRLPAFPNRGQAPRSYVMHFQLAVFVYRRLVQQPTPTINITPADSYGLCTMRAGDYSAAVGTEVEMKALAELLDKIIAAEEPQMRKLRDASAGLQASYDKAAPALNSAVASKRLHGRCDLVPFF